MTLTTLGFVSVATAGIPQPLTTDSTLRATKVQFQVIPGLTGKGFVGTPHMNKITLSGVAHILAPNRTSGISDMFEIASETGSDDISLSQLAIDMEVSGEGLLVSYWVE